MRFINLLSKAIMNLIRSEWIGGRFQEETKNGKKGKKKEKNEKTGGYVPYGFAVDAAKKLIPLDYEQKVLGEIKMLRSKGVSYRGIAAKLQSKKILTKTFIFELKFLDLFKVLRECFVHHRNNCASHFNNMCSS